VAKTVNNKADDADSGDLTDDGAADNINDSENVIGSTSAVFVNFIYCDFLKLDTLVLPVSI